MHDCRRAERNPKAPSNFWKVTLLRLGARSMHEVHESGCTPADQDSHPLTLKADAVLDPERASGDVSTLAFRHAASCRACHVTDCHGHERGVGKMKKVANRRRWPGPKRLAWTAAVHAGQLGSRIACLVGGLRGLNWLCSRVARVRGWPRCGPASFRDQFAREGSLAPSPS